METFIGRKVIKKIIYIVTIFRYKSRNFNPSCNMFGTRNLEIKEKKLDTKRKISQFLSCVEA